MLQPLSPPASEKLQQDDRWEEVPTVTDGLNKIMKEEYAYVTATTSMYLAISDFYKIHK